jgi:hypothetical protein
MLDPARQQQAGLVDGAEPIEVSGSSQRAIEIPRLAHGRGQPGRQRRETDEIDQVVIADRLHPPLRSNIVGGLHPRPEHLGDLGRVDVAAAADAEQIVLEGREPTVAAAPAMQSPRRVQEIDVLGVEDPRREPVAMRSHAQEREIEARAVEAAKRRGTVGLEPREHVGEQLGLAADPRQDPLHAVQPRALDPGDPDHEGHRGAAEPGGLGVEEHRPISIAGAEAHEIAGQPSSAR